jgi:hypothetical protein
VSQTPAQVIPFAQHPRLAEVVNGLRFQRYPLFLSGIVYKEPGGPLRRALVVATRSGDLVAVAGGEIFRYGGRVPTSRLFDDEGFANESDTARLEALSDLNEAFFSRDVAAWTGGRRSINEIGINVLRHWFAPQTVSDTITHSEVLGVVPLEASNGLLDSLRELADRHDRGYMVEQILLLLA